MSRRRQQPDPVSAPDQQDGDRTTLRLLLESALWIWALSVIGYFYYTREFHLWLLRAWEQGLG